MTSQERKKEVVEGLKKSRDEVSKLKENLNQLDNEKESWYSKKQEISSKIKSDIHKINELKAQRDAITKEVKDLKVKRDAFNAQLSEKSKELKAKQPEKEKEIVPQRPTEFRESPGKLKAQMEQLEFKMETEPMSFDKEQALMKKIKQLRKAYDSIRDSITSSRKSREERGELDKIRKDANDIHRQIQEKAKAGQALHEQILKLSAEIDSHKPQEEEALKKFVEYKSKFSEANSTLKGNLKNLNQARDELDKMDYERREQRKMDEESILKSKEEIVNEKIRKGQKLTNEDLLVFQKFGK